MSAGYVSVQWNRHKRRYDGVLIAFVVLYLFSFVSVTTVLHRGDRAIDPPVLLIRALGTCAILLLHIILCIGPLARLSPRFSPFLYNRRHLGVLTFLMGLFHGLLVLGYYHGFGKLNPLLSLLTFDASFGGPANSWPFQLMGLGALIILFLMAATSHDFWLKNLSPRAWKSLHMLIYPAYFLVIAHVTLGALRTETHWLYTALLLAGVFTVGVLHVTAAVVQGRRDASNRRALDHGWIDVCAADDIPESRARGVLFRNEPVAVFKHEGKFSAVQGHCVHQGGPLAEGKIIGGCITCPWHGYQYRPGDGCSPPPFTEKLHTYQVRIRAGRVQVRAERLAPGTAVEPAADLPEASHA